MSDLPRLKKNQIVYSKEHAYYFVVLEVGKGDVILCIFDKGGHVEINTGAIYLYDKDNNEIVV
jgi:hypothetical protein